MALFRRQGQAERRAAAARMEVQAEETAAAARTEVQAEVKRASSTTHSGKSAEMAFRTEFMGWMSRLAEERNPEDGSLTKELLARVGEVPRLDLSAIDRPDDEPSLRRMRIDLAVGTIKGYTRIILQEKATVAPSTAETDFWRSVTNYVANTLP
jgi:hypothetical protein